MKPVLNQLQVVEDAAAVDTNPVNALNPFALKAIFLQRRATEVETF